MEQFRYAERRPELAMTVSARIEPESNPPVPVEEVGIIIIFALVMFPFGIRVNHGYWQVCAYIDDNGIYVTFHDNCPFHVMNGV